MNTCLTGCVNLWVKTSHGKPPPCMFGGHWSTVIGDMKYLIYHLTSQNHMIEGSSNFMSGSPSGYANTLSTLVVICILLVEM